LQLLPSRKLENGAMDLPYVLMSDEAFTLHEDFLKPFNRKDQNPELKIFDYQARRIVEDVF
jgi:hypothetical protein